MTTLASPAARPAAKSQGGPPAGLFAVTVFASAALVFLVEPMVAKLVLHEIGEPERLSLPDRISLAATRAVNREHDVTFDHGRDASTACGTG